MQVFLDQEIVLTTAGCFELGTRINKGEVEACWQHPEDGHFRFEYYTIEWHLQKAKFQKKQMARLKSRKKPISNQN
jgi:hypothetical protein